jgi:metallo-beta-lactamase class B
MQLLKNLYQVGGGLAGLTHTSRFDPFDECNSYLLDLGDSSILFDCGNGETLEQLFANMKYWDLLPDKILHCFLTHSHWDHAGAAHLLKERGINLLAHPVTAESVAAGDERCCGYLYHKSFTPCLVDQTLEDGDSITINHTTIKAHHLPGHTMGCTAYAVEWQGKKLMFSGDVIGTLGYGDFGWDGSIDFDKKIYLESLIKFARMDFDVMLGGHGLVTFAEPKRRVEDSLNQALIQWR